MKINMIREGGYWRVEGVFEPSDKVAHAPIEMGTVYDLGDGRWRVHTTEPPQVAGMASLQSAEITLRATSIEDVAQQIEARTKLVGFKPDALSAATMTGFTEAIFSVLQALAIHTGATGAFVNGICESLADLMAAGVEPQDDDQFMDQLNKRVRERVAQLRAEKEQTKH